MHLQPFSFLICQTKHLFNLLIPLLSFLWLLGTTRATVKEQWQPKALCSNASGGACGAAHIIRGCCIHECNCCNKCTLTLPSLAQQQSLLCCLTKAIQSPTMRVIFSLGGESIKIYQKLFIQNIVSPWPLLNLLLTSFATRTLLSFLPVQKSHFLHSILLNRVNSGAAK